MGGGGEFLGVQDPPPHTHTHTNVQILLGFGPLFLSESEFINKKKKTSGTFSDQKLPIQ